MKEVVLRLNPASVTLMPATTPESPAKTVLISTDAINQEFLPRNGTLYFMCCKRQLPAEKVSIASWRSSCALQSWFLHHLLF